MTYRSSPCPPGCPAASSSASPSTAPLINTPALLLADELIGNLDSGKAAEILDLLTRLR